MSSQLYIEDCTKIPINDEGWYLQGYSRAGDRTGFLLCPLKILFDCGVRTKVTYFNIFMTHTHVDHSGELPYICNRHKIDGKYRVHCPSTGVRHLTLLERSISVLSNPETESYTDEEILNKQKIQFNPINAGDVFTIGDYEIEVLPAYHTVQSIGYGISSVKKGLKYEYKELMKNESIPKNERISKLNEIKKSGIDVNKIIKTHQLAFFCDSNIKNLSEHEEWKKYSVIVCECTGLVENNKTVDDYMKMGHTSIVQLLPIMMEYKEKKWILIHVSSALKQEEILKREKELLNLGLNVYIVK